MSGTILVTGGAGYIGSHTTVELLQAGLDVIVVDNLINSKSTSINRIMEITKKDFPFYCIDLINKNEIERVFAENHIDAVIHLAGLKSVGESVNQPLYYYNNNIKGTLNLLDIMLQYNVKKLVFSSSAAVYGIPDSVPISEENSLNPVNPYGRTKWIIEEILRDLYQSDKNWSIALLRYFNPIGAHESGLIGEDSSSVPNNIMPYITQVAIGKQKELSIFGADYPTLDGTGVRDYIHVVDLATGHLKALNSVLLGQSGVEAYNLGTGKGCSVFQLITIFEGVTGVKIPHRIVKRRQGDVAICFANPSKALKKLKWQAKMGIKEMCLDAWHWQKCNPNGYDI